MAEVNLRKNSHNKLIGFLNQVNNHKTAPLSYYAVGTIVERARDTMAKCEGYHAVLVGNASDSAALAVQESAFTPIEATYQDLMNKLATLLATIPNPAAPVVDPAAAAAAAAAAKAAASVTTPINIKLPAIDLPKFDGSFANWTSFKDLFTATVGNSKQLADSQKLQYLKSSLQGEPATIIKSMAITDANYKESWKLLNERYDNKREIVFSLISKILDYKQLRSENAQELQALIDCVCESVRSLKVLGRPTDEWDDLLVVIVLGKLDPSTRREWAIRQTGSSLPTFEEMCTFISSHIRGLLASVSNTTTFVKREKQVRVHHVNSESPQCQICSKSHHHHQCSELHTRKPADRSALVKKHHLCFNCLSRDHPVKSCSSKRSCRKCGRRHHTLLHFNGERESSSNQVEGFAGEKRSQQQNPDSRVESNHISLQSHAILKTAIVNVPDRHGAHQQCRVFIDGGSQGNFISEACVSRLQLQRNYRSVTVTGFASTHVGTSRGEVTVQLVSRHNHLNSIEIKAHVMPRLSSFLPSAKVKKQSWPHLEGLQLADPRWYKPGGVDIVVGVKHYTKIIRKERSEGGDHDPVALESIFGWIICGEAKEEEGSTLSSMHISITEDLDFIRKFWESEEFPNPRILTKEERECEEHFLKTHKRGGDGRFIAAIPFNGKQKKLGVSRDAAVRRLFQVERRLNRNPVYKEQYVSFMKEYHQLGHMIEIPANQVREVAGATNYLPHHFVLNEDSTTTKLRVVFDGSAKSSSGLSLNDTMMVGATLQDDLYDLLLRFRSYPIVLKADIAKMFRQFQLFPEDADFHRIVWRESANEPVRDFRLSTITYGTACATNLSTRCLQQLASDCEDKFPAAATALKESMFVDDILSGETNIEKAIELVKELQSAAKTAGLELRKWCTNSQEVLEQIPEALREMDPQNFQDEESSVKTLGVRWHPSTDEFRFTKFVFNKVKELTMRLLLSNLARVYDPLGLISCVTVRAKIIYQELWRLSLVWDEHIPEHVSQLWNEYEENLKLLSSLQIPRRVTADNATKVELHGFADASERALGGICYIRSETPGGVEVHLVTSKTKVAPLKQVSIPRLELDAALLTAKLVVRVSKSLKLTNAELFLWSDSTIVLRWIASPPRRWKTFVANRVAKIQDLTPVESWRHVPGLENPADLASRGVAVEEILNSTMWWKGPAWLLQQQLPLFVTPPTADEDMEERNLPVLTNSVSMEQSFMERYSSLLKLNRATAYLQRFLKWIKKKEINNGPLLAMELDRALVHWIKQVQQQHFCVELRDLRSNKKIKSNSKISSLHPFLDTNGVLRVSGRLHNADLPENCKHPVILPGNSHLVYLLVQHYHHSMLHAGFQQIWSSLSRKYWIIRGRDRVRHIIRSCVVCRRYRANTAEQLMGSLPESRVTKSRPFLHTGIDFAGPFVMKNPVGRAPKTYKGYLCIFICMATKAIHLEAVSSLSTDAFLDALRRFVSRRGLCSHIYTDQGTNFVGADRELQKFVRDKKTNEEVADGLSSSSIQWHFNPAYSPHRGGLWEAAVKSAKFHLRRVIGNSYLTYEQFSTILCQIEAVLNSRPLTQLSSDPGDFDVLTPGHFLIGEPLVAVPDSNVENVPINRLNSFKQQQQRVLHFWRRWSREYLNTLQQRNKWRWEKDDVRVGDLVLVVEDSSPGLWKMGRIQETHPGGDGRVRVVTVKTATSVMQRPIVKLVPLLREEN